MRLWPQKRWKQVILILLIALVVVFIVFISIAGMLMSGMINREIVSEVEILNADGTKTALIVYQPGFSSSPRDYSYAFAEGLAASNWKVEITTASPQAPSDLSKYSLVTFAFPVYGGTAGTAVVSYINRIGDLGGVDTVILACGGGDVKENLNPPLKQQVQDANGNFYKGLSLSAQDSSGSMQIIQQTTSSITP
ncbi:MAG: hypothetical protein NWF01_02440 [Candidatus Bathyarchaeota archaeon]|nr:hypothetical protein [Candidatus Bathyarchaeota archaeon]